MRTSRLLVAAMLLAPGTVAMTASPRDAARAAQPVLPDSIVFGAVAPGARTVRFVQSATVAPRVGGARVRARRDTITVGVGTELSLPRGVVGFVIEALPGDPALELSWIAGSNSRCVARGRLFRLRRVSPDSLPVIDGAGSKRCRRT